MMENITDRQETAAAMVRACRKLAESGLVEGTSGNISVRHGAGMLVTPSAVEYAAMTPEMMVEMALDGSPPAPGQAKPSSEWRFHRDILAARPEIGAIVHTHSPHATAISMTRRPIPAAHYMVAAFGGTEVRCADYATFGTQALSDAALDALAGRTACLLANHGAIALGESLDRAMWRAAELEVLARQHILALQAGEPVVLSGDEMAEVQAAFGDYRPEAPTRRS